MLQTRSGKRTAQASVKIAVDMVKEKLISKKEAILKIDPNLLDTLLHPTLDEKSNIRVMEYVLRGRKENYENAQMECDRIAAKRQVLTEKVTDGSAHPNSRDSKSPGESVSTASDPSIAIADDEGEKTGISAPVAPVPESNGVDFGANTTALSGLVYKLNETNLKLVDAEKKRDQLRANFEHLSVALTYQRWYLNQHHMHLDATLRQHAKDNEARLRSVRQSAAESSHETATASTTGTALGPRTGSWRPLIISGCFSPLGRCRVFCSREMLLGGLK